MNYFQKKAEEILYDLSAKKIIKALQLIERKDSLIRKIYFPSTQSLSVHGVAMLCNYSNKFSEFIVSHLCLMILPGL